MLLLFFAFAFFSSAEGEQGQVSPPPPSFARRKNGCFFTYTVVQHALSARRPKGGRKEKIEGGSLEAAVGGDSFFLPLPPLSIRSSQISLFFYFLETALLKEMKGGKVVGGN